MFDRWLSSMTFSLHEQTEAMNNIKRSHVKVTAKPVTKVSFGQTRCEWNPVLKCPAWRPRHEFDCPNKATVQVGKEETWRICKRCAELPEFQTFIEESLIEV